MIFAVFKSVFVFGYIFLKIVIESFVNCTGLQAVNINTILLFFIFDRNTMSFAQ